jgi:hypothetical protein
MENENGLESQNPGKSYRRKVQLRTEPDEGSAENAKVDAHADAGGGQAAEGQAADLDGPTHAEFLAYLDDEIRPIATKFGYKVELVEVAPSVDSPWPDAGDKTLWPSWFYDPMTKQGEVFVHPREVPKGWVRNPHAPSE